MLRARRALIEISEDMVCVSIVGGGPGPEFFLSYEEGAVGLLGKEDVYKLPRNVLNLLNSLLFLP